MNDERDDEMPLPDSLEYLEGLVDDPSRSGMIRWRELQKLNRWLTLANGKRRKPGWKKSAELWLEQASKNPHKIFQHRAHLPGRSAVVIYKIAKRANCSPQTVICAAVNFGLERMRQVLREAKEIPPALTDEQLSAYPIAK